MYDMNWYVVQDMMDRIAHVSHIDGYRDLAPYA